MSSADPFIKSCVRVHAQSEQTPRVVPLSLLDATAADFALTSAIWLFDRPIQSHGQQVNLSEHLGSTLAVALDAYPQWTGQIVAITTTDGIVPEEAAHLPAHTRRFGRVYAKFGHKEDPGVAFTTALCNSALHEVYPESRTTRHVTWDVDESRLSRFIPKDAIANSFQPHGRGENGVLKPVMAIQLTELSCGGFVLAAKVAHPLADISSLTHFMKHWSCISRAALNKEEKKSVTEPIFDPSKLDSLAMGDINAVRPDPQALQIAKQVPLHRYDWWTSAATCPWKMSIPEPFREENLTPAGEIMPWSEWNINAPVARAIIHFTREQVEVLWNTANREDTPRISRHDAVLAHIWSCIARARETDDSSLVHCDLVCGARTPLQLGNDFIGSPTYMINVEMAGADVAGRKDGSGTDLQRIASSIRSTIKVATQASHVAAHLHSIAFEKSPQRIWQAFLGRRHILVTSWVRSGVWDVDFGLGSLRYVDSVMPNMDGVVVIKEAQKSVGTGESGGASWTDAGVDVDVRIAREDMERLREDLSLLPTCGP